MSVQYMPVIWNRNKIVYDAVLLIAVALYLYLYIRVGPAFEDVSKPHRRCDPPHARLRQLRLPDAHGDPVHRSAGAPRPAVPAAALQPPPLRCHDRGYCGGSRQLRARLVFQLLADRPLCRPARLQHQLRPDPRLSLRGLRYRGPPDPVRAGRHQPRFLAEFPRRADLEGAAHVHLCGLCLCRAACRPRRVAGTG